MSAKPFKAKNGIDANNKDITDVADVILADGILSLREIDLATTNIITKVITDDVDLTHDEQHARMLLIVVGAPNKTIYYRTNAKTPIVLVLNFSGVSVNIDTKSPTGAITGAPVTIPASPSATNITVYPESGQVVDVTTTPDANDVKYDNTSSGLTATDVQAALDELKVSGSGTIVRNVTSTTTLLTSDDVLVCDGSFTVNLYAAASFGREVTIANKGSGAITVTCDGSDTFADTSTSIVLSAGESARLIVDNSSPQVWVLI